MVMNDSDKEKLYKIADRYDNDGREFLLISPQNLKDLLNEIERLKSSIDFIENTLNIVRKTNESSDNG